jgi:23S rRNA-/tRNA-specific pseudouridylate synthase
VVGDARYGSKRAADYLKKNFAFDRLALHAHALTFQLPGGTEPETVTTPAIPGQLQNLFKNDRENRFLQQKNL